MAYGGLFLFIILIVGAQLKNAPTRTQEVGIPDLQQVTMVPHCIIDECTIASYKSGQQLEIIYTTDSVLVVTPTGNQTALVIVRTYENFYMHKEYFNFLY